MSDQPTVPFLDLSRAVEAERGALEEALGRVLDSGRFVLGDEVRDFESEFAAAMGASHAVGVASGTDAIELALRGLRIGPGDEVVTQANTCVPTVAGIERAGAAPRLCDVEPAAGTMDPTSLEAAITDSTRAVVVVHLYGQCADMDAIGAVAAARGVAVVEDCAQAHGATFRRRNAGTMGLLGAFSFYPTKNLGAIGDGGAVVTGDGVLAERLRMLRQYGQVDRYRHEHVGVNSRLDELQAAILRARLRRLAEGNARRAAIAAVYDEALAGTPVEPLAQLPDRGRVFHLYVVRAPGRERFQEELARRGVQTLIHYPLPIHGQPAYRGLAGGVPLASSERLAAEVVSLPLFPELTDAEVEHVAGAAGAAARASARAA